MLNNLMIKLILLVLAITMVFVAGYLITNDGVKIEVDKNNVIVDQVTNTGEGLENEIIDFNKPERGYS